MRRLAAWETHEDGDVLQAQAILAGRTPKTGGAFVELFHPAATRVLEPSGTSANQFAG